MIRRDRQLDGSFESALEGVFRETVENMLAGRHRCAALGVELYEATVRGWSAFQRGDQQECIRQTEVAASLRTRYRSERALNG